MNPRDLAVRVARLARELVDDERDRMSEDIAAEWSSLMYWRPEYRELGRAFQEALDPYRRLHPVRFAHEA